MFKLIYRKSPACFALKCYYKDVGKNPIKNIENCQSYAACRFEKSYFESFEIPFRVIRGARGGARNSMEQIFF